MSLSHSADKYYYRAIYVYIYMVALIGTKTKLHPKERTDAEVSAGTRFNSSRI